MTKNELDKDGVFVTLCALRYALGRQSYATAAVADYIKEHWDDEAMVSRHQMIIRDVEEFLHMRNKGDLDTRVVWKPLLAWMVERENNNNKTNNN